MNILVASSKTYLQPMKNMLYSLFVHTGGNHHIYFAYRKLVKEDIMQLEKFLRDKCNAQLHLIDMDADFLQGSRIGMHFSVEMYYRIFVSELVPEDIDRIMWLDCDLIFEQDVTAFYEQDFRGNSVIACVDQYESLFCTRNKELGLPDEHRYFNSGVMIFDLEKIRKEFDREKVISLIMESGDLLKFPDQDILNMLYCKDVLYGDPKYNFQYFQYWEKESTIYDYLLKDFAVLHYVSVNKPWKSKYLNKMQRYYWKYELLQRHYIKYGIHMCLEGILFVLVHAKRILLRRNRTTG